MKKTEKKWIALLLAAFFFVSHTVFGEQLQISFGEFTAIINETMGYMQRDRSVPYSDYIGEAAVMVAQEKGYLVTDGQAGAPEYTKSVTNAEAAVMFVRVSGLTPPPDIKGDIQYSTELKWASEALLLCQYLQLPVDFKNPGEPIDRYNAYALISYLEAISDEDTENPYSMELAGYGDNFYKAVNNPWLLRMAVEKPGQKISRFSEAEKMADGQVTAVIEDSVKNQYSYEKGTDRWKIAEIYKLSLDTAARDAAGLTPLMPYLERVWAVKDMEDMRTLLADLGQDFGQPVLFRYAVLPSPEDNTVNELRLYGPALMLGDESYYDGSDRYTKGLRESARAYMSELLRLLNIEEGKAFRMAQKMYAFEEEAATNRKAEVTVDSNGRRISRATLEVPYQYKNLQPEKIIRQMGFSNLQQVVVEEPEVLRAVDSFFVEDNLEVIKHYVACVLLGNCVDILSSSLKEVHNQFLQKLSLQTGEREPEEFAQEMVMRFMGNAVERIYADTVVREVQTREVEMLAEDIREQLRKLVLAGDLLSEEAKAVAVRKLDMMRVKVGAPRRWTDYSFLSVQPAENGGSLFSLYRQTARMQVEQAQTALANPVYKNEWHIPAYEVNAVYTPAYNDIIIPAGLFQDPFYSPQMAKEEKLGGIGTIIAHEMSHALYGAGSRYDEYGNENTWWTMTDYQKFYSKTNAISAYFSRVELMPEIFVNGKNTLEESVADISAMGCILAVLEKGKGGYDMRIFFESYAKSLAMRAQESDVTFDALLGAHLPMAARVNNIVSLFDAFYRAFDVKEEQAMFVPEKDRIIIW